jgi:hypothetical protein
MRAALILLGMVVFMWGCGNTNPAAKTDKKEEVPQELITPAAPQEVPQEAVPVKETAQVPAVTPSFDGEKIIEGNRWSLSVYDPSTGTRAYYSSDGALLGKKQK